MILISAPGWGKREIEHVVMDFNGTLAVDGHIVAGVDERLPRLSIMARIHICSADFFGTVADETRHFELALKVLKSSNQSLEKAEFVRRLGPLKVAAIGNGRNDFHMLKEAAIGIAVVGPEGAHPETIAAADVVCVGVNHALDLLLNPERLASTLQR
jgi:soluble P-type ATPase